MRTFLLAGLLAPSVLFAQKPDCETIRKMVEEDRAKSVEKLEAENAALEKLRNDIRRNRAKLEGKDGKKPPREQLKIVVDKIKANETQIEKAKKVVSINALSFTSLKPGSFGSFGKYNSDNFLINEIIDKQSFTAFLRYSVYVPDPGGLLAFRRESRTSRTLYLVKGIKTEGLADNREANWKGYLYCSGTEKLELNSGAETVFVLEPFDVDACFKEDEPKSPSQSP